VYNNYMCLNQLLLMLMLMLMMMMNDDGDAM